MCSIITILIIIGIALSLLKEAAKLGIIILASLLICGAIAGITRKK